MHRLEQFVVGILLPNISQLPKVSDLETHPDMFERIGGSEEAFGSLSEAQEPAEGEDAAWLGEIRAEIIESFLWLHLGVEIGSFSEEFSRAVYETYLAPFFKSLLSRNRRVLDQMRFDDIYVAHSRQL